MKTDERSCPLCLSKANLTREHVLPRWFLEAYPAQTGEFATQVDGRPARKPSGAGRPPQQTFFRVTLPICAACQGALNTRFELPGKPVIRGLWQGQGLLDAIQARAFAMWILKTWLLLAHPEAVVSDPGWRIDPWDLTRVEGDLYSWMVTGDDPPDGLSIWLTRSSEASVVCVGRIPLPTIVTDHCEIAFEVIEHGFDFLDSGALDIALVYHPGWPIDHPLESAGCAARLWPREPVGEVDIDHLPSPHSGAVSWLTGPRLLFESGTFPGGDLSPLSPSTNLLLPPSPPGCRAVMY